MIRRFALSAAVVAVAAVAVSAAGTAATPRFSVTLAAEVDTFLEYVLPGTTPDGCGYSQVGRSGRLIEITSTRPTIVRVRGGRAASYVPSELRALRLRRRDHAGDAVRTVSCPDGRTFSESMVCEPVQAVTTDALAQLRFRRANGGRIAWSMVAQPTITPCGLEDKVEPGWLDLAVGKANERALVPPSRRIVRVRGERRIDEVVITRPGGTRIRRAIVVRWTLTFRRLS